MGLCCIALGFVCPLAAQGLSSTAAITLSIESSKVEQLVELNPEVETPHTLHRAVQKKVKTTNSPDRWWFGTLLLVFFLGFLGVHRLYLGYIGIALLQAAIFALSAALFTLSIESIFFLLAAIAIAAGLFYWVYFADLPNIYDMRLKPKNGYYTNILGGRKKGQ
jgi:TM2 domain-containing membrane protein YozV